MSAPRPTPPPYEIVQCTGDAGPIWQQCFDVRVEVFHNEQGFPLDTERDNYDSDPCSLHLLLRLKPSLEPVGTIRLAARSKLSRLAVRAPYRKYGLGRVLVQALHDAVRARGGGEIVAHSQTQALGFYQKLGYVQEGGVFDEDGGPHVLVRVKLPPSGEALDAAPQRGQAGPVDAAAA